MTVDEYAFYERSVNGLSLRQIDGIWWYQPRPCFFRPLFPFEDLPENVAIPWQGALLGGAQYPVTDERLANTKLNLLACDQVRAYNLKSMDCSLRSQIRKGLRSFEFRQVSDPGVLVREGHTVYLEFLERTQYGHNNSRQDRAEFARWVEAVFRCPKVRVIGAFANGSLAAVTLSFLVRDVLFYNVYFGNKLALANRASDGMLHTIRESAGSDPRIRMVFSALAGMPRGLDRFYLLRGFRVIPRPAVFRGNPLALLALRHLAPSQYRKLVGGNEASLVRSEAGVERVETAAP